MHLFAAAASVGESAGSWPFVVLGISILFIILAITVLRLHAFLALILAALVAGFLTPWGTLPTELRESERIILKTLWEREPASAEALRAALSSEPEVVAVLDSTLDRMIASGRLKVREVDGVSLYRPGLTEVQARKISTSHFVHVVEQAARDFGNSAGGIGIVIALAAIIGMGLMESGAADKIVRRFMSVFGEQRAGAALLASGFFLSIPVFFDTVFFLLIPLARALGVRTGRQFMFYVMAIGGGGALTHSIVPPTPGPLLVGNELNLPLGVTILTGFLAGLPPAIVGLYVARWLDRKVPVPVREVPGASLADLNAVISRKDEELPPFWLSVLPVVLPVAFIALASFLAMARDSMPGLVSAMGGQESFAAIFRWFDFLGNKIVALLIGALLALGIHLHQSRLTFAELGQRLGPPLETAGIIILITSAGGAFGAMIRHAGVGDSIKAMAEGYNISLILLAWTVTAVVRVAQGSATVAMITGAGLMAGVIGDGSGLPYHPFYIYLAIGFGSMILSWMNDSGFWVVAKLSGFTEKETLKSWTVLLTVLSVVGLIQTLIVAAILPLRMAPMP